MPKKTAPAKNDLDALIADELETNRANATHAEIVLGDQVWELTDQGSIVSGLDLFSGDEERAAPAFIDWLTGMVIEEQQNAFRALLRRIQGLDVPLLMKIGNAMTEELMERPTKPSAASSDNSIAPASETPSTGTSSSQVALASPTSEPETL